MLPRRRGLWQAADEADVFDGELHRPAACLGEDSPDGYGHERAARDVGARAFSGEAAVADRRRHRVVLVGIRDGVGRVEADLRARDHVVVDVQVCAQRLVHDGQRSRAWWRHFRESA